MKIALPALAAASIIGAVGTASAAHAPAHRQHPASDYNAFSPKAFQDPAARPYWWLDAGSDDDSHQTATGGPAGGIY